MRMKPLNVLFFLLLLSCFGHSKRISPEYIAIFSFGDSFTDTGNLAILKGPHLLGPQILNRPYGVTYFHYPTGRCSNGRIVLDFIAQKLGLPFVKPYWKRGVSFIQGANFAVAGATALDYDFYVKNNLANDLMFNTSLNIQLTWFQQLKPSLCAKPRKCKDYFARSLFLLGEIGANDYTFMMMAGMTLEEATCYVPKIIRKISKAAESLIKSGAVTMVVPGMWPSGCAPVNLAQNTSRPKSDYEPKTGCLKKLNELSISHNLQLVKAVKQLQVKYPHVRLIHAEYYRPIIDFIKFPKRFGLIGNPLRVCCGEGSNRYNFNQSEGCGVSNADYCKKPSSYINWDGIHLTEAAYHYIADGWLDGFYAYPPILSALHH